MDEVLTINQQIAELQKKSADLQKKNRPAVVAELREKMLAYGISVKELSRPVSKSKKMKPDAAAKQGRAPKVKKISAPVAAKYRGPEGQAWSGRGIPPKWIKDLMASGRTKDEFLIAI